VKCTATTRDNRPCPMEALRGHALCFSHGQIARAAQEKAFARASVVIIPFEPKPKTRPVPRVAIPEPVYEGQILDLPLHEIDRRMQRLTAKELEALECLCEGWTYKTGGVTLGVTDASFTNRITLATRAAGVKTRLQLVAMYAIWKCVQTERENKNHEQA
jgi:hypothetical protein